MATPENLWLSDDQQRVWRAYLHGVARISDRLDAALRPHGLDLAEYEIFVALSEAPEHCMRMSDLADVVHQSRSRLTHAVGRMENSGWLTRSKCPNDRRGVIAHLTDDGFALLAELAPGHVRSVRDAFIDLVDPADYAALGRAMDAVLSAQ